MLAVVRAHVTALGGNALVSFYMTELILVDNPHKNQVKILNYLHFWLGYSYNPNFFFLFLQGQCLISVGGDVVFVSYFSDD